MKLKTRYLIRFFIYVTLLTAIFSISAFAADTLLLEKPATAPIESGFVTNGGDCTGDCTAHIPTNVKWEIYNEGTDASPEYTLYLSIDNEGYKNAKNYDGKYADNTVLYSFAPTQNGTIDNHAYKRTTGTSYGSKHSWSFDTGIPASKIKTIVIGDGITESKTCAFVDMTGVQTVEMPTSLKTLGEATFRGCTSLKTVYTRGQTPRSGVFDLRNITSLSTAEYSFYGCKSVEEYIFADNCTLKFKQHCFRENEALKVMNIPEGVTTLEGSSIRQCLLLQTITLPSTLTTIGSDVIYHCPVLTEVIFQSDVTITYISGSTTREEVVAAKVGNTFRACPLLETIYAPVGSGAHTFAMQFGFETTNTSVTYSTHGNTVTMTYYPENDHMLIESAETKYWDFNPKNDAMFTTFINIYKDMTESLTLVGYFGKINLYSTADPQVGVFSGWDMLESICFPEGARLVNKTGEGNMFAANPQLTTIYFGDEADMTYGVADFRGMECAKGDRPDLFAMSCFSGCTSLEKVILPSLNDSESNKIPTIYDDTFKDCTSLKSITVPATIGLIENGAFESCTALKSIDYLASVSLIGIGTFNGGGKGLCINCQSYEDAIEINRVLTEANISSSSVFAFYKTGMSLDGYSIKVEITENANNGLRTFFGYDESIIASYGEYELVEYGSLSTTAERWAEYDMSYGYYDSIFQLNDEEFITPKKIVKTPVFKNGEHINKHTINGNKVSFVVTVTNFAGEDQYKAEIVSVGYEIWKNGDSYYVLFTRETAKGYESTSLYKTTHGMLAGKAITVEKGNNPVWNVLSDCEHTLSTPFENIERYMFADPLDASKKIAIYLTESDEEIIIDDTGFSAEELAGISYFVLGKNITLSIN